MGGASNAPGGLAGRLFKLGLPNMTMFDQLIPVQPTLLYGRGNPVDPRLGESVLTRPNDYDTANVVIVGCPQDEGVARNQGRVGAAQAPTEIRRALYRFVQPPSSLLRLFDLGDTLIQPTLEETHAAHTAIIQQVLQDGKCVISLGGGNDLAYADGIALASATAEFIAINLDAHFDVREDEIRNSGTPYRQLIDEGYLRPEYFFEVGSIPMSNSVFHRQYLLKHGVTIIDVDAVYQRGLMTILAEILDRAAEAIFWGLDMDVVRAADAPGVSAVNPIGISGYDFSQIGVIAAKDRRTRIFEITEVNPMYDVDSRTARLAAATIHQFISNFAFEE
ncbi:MAG: formimidoylglutamase [Anaerolineae bacterium]